MMNINHNATFITMMIFCLIFQGCGAGVVIGWNQRKEIKNPYILTEAYGFHSEEMKNISQQLYSLYGKDFLEKVTTDHKIDLNKFKKNFPEPIMEGETLFGVKTLSYANSGYSKFRWFELYLGIGLLIPIIIPVGYNNTTLYINNNDIVSIEYYIHRELILGCAGWGGHWRCF